MKKKHKLSLPTIAYLVSLVLAFMLLLYIGIREQPDIYEARTESGYRQITDYTVKEYTMKEAPVEIIKEYTYTLDSI